MSQMNAGSTDQTSRPMQQSVQMQQSAPMDAAWGPPPLRREPATARPAPRQPLLGGRLAGPGGYYNLGNAIGLLGGVALAIVAASGPDGPTLQGGAQAALDYLAGNASAICVSLAMLIFFVSGEAYHRAWANGFPPDPALNRHGDLLSGYGALALGAGLFLLGQPVLAATAGLLHAFGKFGSALVPGVPAGGPPRLHAAFRLAVLASRLPALVLVLFAIAVGLGAPGGADPMALAAPGLLVVCYLLWIRADLLLLRS